MDSAFVGYTTKTKTKLPVIEVLMTGPAARCEGRARRGRHPAGQPDGDRLRRGCRASASARRPNAGHQQRADVGSQPSQLERSEYLACLLLQHGLPGQQILIARG